MKIAISNLAWDVDQDDAVLGLLKKHGIRGIEIAPTKIWEQPLAVPSEERATYGDQWAARGIEMHLLTFERELPVERQQALNEMLAQAGITWHTLRYHKRPSLPATLYDIVVGALKAWRICRAHDITFIHARSHVPAAMAWLLARGLRDFASANRPSFSVHPGENRDPS